MKVHNFLAGSLSSEAEACLKRPDGLKMRYGKYTWQDDDLSS